MEFQLLSVSQLQTSQHSFKSSNVRHNYLAARQHGRKCLAAMATRSVPVFPVQLRGAGSSVGDAAPRSEQSRKQTSKWLMMLVNTKWDFAMNSTFTVLVCMLHVFVEFLSNYRTCNYTLTHIIMHLNTFLKKKNEQLRFKDLLTGCKEFWSHRIKADFGRIVLLLKFWKDFHSRVWRVIF